MFQAKALANAVFAYASNIDDLGKLTNAIGIIAQKHVSFQVPQNSYQDVGTELLKSIKEILGDAATDEIMVAWKEGYFFLANTFINLESQIKKEQLDRLDGWNGFEKASISCPAKLCHAVAICTFPFHQNSVKKVMIF